MLHLTIKAKITYMIPAILLLIILSGSWIYSTVTPVADSWTNYQQQAAQRQKLLMQIKANFGYGGMIHNFKNYVLRGQDKYLQRVENNFNDLTKAISQYHQLNGLSQQEKTALANIKKVAENYYNNSKTIKQQTAENKTAEQIDATVKISDKPAFDAFKVLDDHYNQMTNEVSTQINGAISSSQSSMFTALLTLAIVITAVLGKLYVSVIPPLQRLNQTMNDIAEGDGDLCARLEHSNEVDELTQVAKSFNFFIKKIRNIIIEQKQVTGKIANSAGTLKSLTDSSNQAIQNQLAHTEQLASAVTEMTATVDDVASNATTASDSTAQADNTAAQGQTAVTNTVNQIQNINQHLDQASKVVDQVNDASGQIGQVLSVISDIADQTNLLALNAAIEAARAGESGRGFAVVADEVRGLAQRTAVSLSDINSIITQLQSGAKDAVSTMEQGAKEVATGANIAQQAGSNLSNIVQEIRTIHDMNRQIATATEEQSVVTAQMNQDVHEISSMSSSISNDSQQIAEQSINLAAMTDQLQNLVGSFKTDK